MGTTLVIKGADFSSCCIGSAQTTTYAYVYTAVNPIDGGSVSGSGRYTTGSSVTLTATAASGYTFTRWNDGITTASRTVVVGSSNSTYTANFSVSGSSGDDSGSTTYTWQDVDVSSLDRYSCVLVSTGKWYSNNTSQLHVKIAVTPGEHLKVSAQCSDGNSYHDTYGTYYAFMSSSHAEPVSNGATPSFATGASATRIEKADGEVELVAPSDAAYFVMNLTDGASPVNPFTITIKRGVAS